MSQTPHPHDPFAPETGSGLPEQPMAPEGPSTQAPAPQDEASPTSDPSLHPHDPFARAASTQPAGASADPEQISAVSPYGASAPSAGGAPDPYAAPGAPAAGAPQPLQAPHGNQGPYGQQNQQGQYAQQGQFSQQQAPHSGPQDVPPPGTKGVYDGPLSGEPITESDSRLWGMFSQLSVTLGHVISWGFLGWVGPLIIFLVYKDRDRFVRFHAAEALNGAISVLIAQVALSIVLGIFSVITLGLGSPLLMLIPVPALVQFIFSIIGAVKANQGQWWGYPLTIRLVK